MSQASKNSPVPSGKFGCSSPSDNGNCPPPDNAQWKVLKTHIVQIISKKFNLKDNLKMNIILKNKISTFF